MQAPTSNNAAYLNNMDFTDPTKPEAAASKPAEIAADHAERGNVTPPSQATYAASDDLQDVCSFRKQMPLLIADIAILVFSIIAVSCLAGQLQGQWEGSSSTFALFTTVSAIIFFAIFAVVRMFALRRFDDNAGAVKGFLFANMGFAFVYFVFFIATASDWVHQVHQMDKFNKVFGTSVVSTSEAVAFIVFAYMSAFVCLISMVLLAMYIHKAMRA